MDQAEAAGHGHMGNGHRFRRALGEHAGELVAIRVGVVELGAGDDEDATGDEGQFLSRDGRD